MFNSSTSMVYPCVIVLNVYPLACYCNWHKSIAWSHYRGCRVSQFWGILRMCHSLASRCKKHKSLAWSRYRGYWVSRFWDIWRICQLCGWWWKKYKHIRWRALTTSLVSSCYIHVIIAYRFIFVWWEEIRKLLNSWLEKGL
jgi:hypothetical protein